MRRWDVLVGISGTVAILAFSFLIVVMVNPKLADFSAAAYVALSLGALGTIFGIVGMSREATSDILESEDAFPMAGRLDVYRTFRRGQSRGSDE